MKRKVQCAICLQSVAPLGCPIHMILWKSRRDCLTNHLKNIDNKKIISQCFLRKQINQF